MALFQEAIIKKHLLTLDEHVLDSAYNEYKRVYSPDKIKNIRVAKEEQYQEGFIKEIFGSVLGYSVYPESPFNIETEKKNETNARKADGAILSGEKVVGVIELKDNKTKNLDAVKDQAFGYKNNHKDCSYVISSNFHKLRFYIDDATDYEEFDLYNLDKETFKRFYLYLRKEGLLDKNLPKLLRQETKFHEEEISKKLYKDYSNFKRRFFENAVQNNPQHDKLELFKKSQKFLDRILFLLFAEDKGLVGTNSIVSIVEKWSGADDDYYQPLYEMVNKYFGHLYRGYTYQKTGEVIPQFGGELFAPDELLESLKIDDEVLKNDLLILSKYDFNTDVDVNILGHIFEHSLNEVDDVEAELRGETLDKSKSKRKKDGVFYTPKYITKYIVDNTLGKLCTEKKIELKLDEDIAIFEYQKADGKLNEKGKELFERLNTYKSWLLTIKVCDPACGSGAFLNQALSYFIEEHKFVDDIIAELTNTPLRLFDTDLQILENNIFGVDINEESVEIAKLSMWLRTAQPGRKLSDLSNNIKCGNSLIDDPAVAGDKAFNWEKEFPTVFEKGGFDVVIGNPPYVRQELLGQLQKDFFAIKYKNVFNGIADLYVYFYDLSFKILKTAGKMGFITPNKWLERKYGFELRNYLIQLQIEEIVNLNKMSIFDDAIADPSIFIFTNSINASYPLKYKCPSNIEDLFNETSENFEKAKFEKDMWRFSSDKNQGIIDKFKSGETTIKSYTKGGVYYGVKTGLNQAFIINEVDRMKIITNDANSEQIVQKMVEGDDFKRWHLNFSGRFMITTFPSKKIDIDKFNGVKTFLSSFGSRIEQSGEKGSRKKSVNKWYETQDTIAYSDIFKLPKIIYYHTAINHNFYFDVDGYYISANCYFIGNADRYLQCILNSKFFNFIKYFLFPHFGDVENSRGVRLDGNIMNNLPLKEIPDSQKAVFDAHAESITIQSRNIEDLRLKLVNYINSRCEGIKLSRKLSTWYALEFVDFIKELNKAIKTAKGTPLTKKDEFEWMELFEENKKKALDLKTQIDQTDKEIDHMVYALYGLTEEEIQIVENS